MRTAKALIRLGGAQADLSLRWAHIHFVGFVMSRLISHFRNWWKEISSEISALGNYRRVKLFSSQSNCVKY